LDQERESARENTVANYNTIARLLELNGDTTRLVFDRDGGPGCYPAKPFGIELPSGLVHWFESEMAARNSQHWPSK